MAVKPFGINPREIFASGVSGYFRNLVPLTLGALATLGVYGAFRLPAQGLLDDDRVWAGFAVELVGLLIAATIAYPWYSWALAAADGEKADLRAPFQRLDLFGQQAIASVFFWAGVLLGVRYRIFGLPLLLILIVLLYSFYGYVIADGASKKGMLALGTSVRLTEGRRFGLFALASIFAIFNLFGASFGAALGNFGSEELEFTAGTIAGAVVGLSVTTSITLVGGAAIYRTLKEDLNVSDR